MTEENKPAWTITCADMPVGKALVWLVKDSTPLAVHPKPEYRPCLKKYPIKQETIDGITPVFEALHEAGEFCWVGKKLNLVINLAIEETPKIILKAKWLRSQGS